MTDLAAQLQRPANFVGLHFFNPVPASTLIEVVLAKETSPALATTAKAWTEALGKTAVVVNDAPGFASSRLGVAIALEAMRMVEEGVASAEDIDAAMVLGYKHPTGRIPVNHASVRLLTKCGFRQEGLARKYLKINGRWEDHLLFGRLADDR